MADADAMLSNVRVRTLFSSPLVTLTRYRCTVGHATPTPEQAQPSHVVAFPHARPFVLHHQGRAEVVGVNVALCLNAGASYCSSHPFGGSDHGSAIVIEPGALIEMLALRSPGVAEHPDRPFLVAAMLTQPGTYLAQRMLVRLAEADPQAVLAIEETALAVAASALRVAPPGSPLSRGSVARRDLAMAVVAALERDLPQSLSLQALAHELGFSPFHLARTFKQEVGLSIHRWRNRLRLRAALARLGGVRGGLSELAVSLGYVSHSHFTAAFHAEFGVAPSQLRRACSARDILRLLPA